MVSLVSLGRGGFSTSRRLYFPNWGRILFPFARRDFFCCCWFRFAFWSELIVSEGFSIWGTGKHFERMCTFQLNAPCLGGFRTRLFKGLFGLNLCHEVWESIQTWYFQVADSNKPSLSLSPSETRLGRRPVFYFSVLIITAGRLISMFTASYYLVFSIAAVLGSLTANSIFQAPLIIAMEISKRLVLVLSLTVNYSKSWFQWTPRVHLDDAVHRLDRGALHPADGVLGHPGLVLGADVHHHTDLPVYLHSAVSN